MRNIFVILVSLLITSCGKDCYDIERSNLTCNDHCEHEEYHVTCLENGECFKSLFIKGRLEKGTITVNVVNGEQNQYGVLNIKLRKNKISCDTLFFRGTAAYLEDLSFSDVFLFYGEGDQILGGFKIPTGGGTKEDYVIVDYINEDTTEIAGRFQVEFTERFVGLPIGMPPNMSITCGSFRVKVEEI